MDIWGHTKTITKHRWLVMVHCFKMGLYLQGLVHDLSKYSPAEFIPGCRYYQGSRSPNNAEREDIGYSSAWMHHKGRNKHHFEYWNDLSLTERGKVVPVRMPRKYVAEMAADRIAACKVYRGAAYEQGAAYDYLIQGSSYTDPLMHADTLNELKMILKMVKDQGEDYAFDYVKNVYLKSEGGGSEKPSAPEGPIEKYDV